MATPRPNDSTRPEISVVICAYTADRLEAIARAIASIEAQTLPPLEVVLVIDHAPELLEVCRQRWPWLTVVPNEEKQGLSGARNTGVGESRGEVVAFLDDDAAAAPDWLERIAADYDDPSVVGVGGTVVPDWDGGRPRWFPAEFDWVVGCTHSGMPSERSEVRNLVGANMSFRRDSLVGVGGFSSDLGRVGTLPVGCEETDVCIRISDREADARIVYDPAATVSHEVPRSRSRFAYFRQRCSAEGRSKAVLTTLVGSDSGLSSERSYVRRTLPLGFARGLRDALRGDASGLARSAALVAGLLATTAGFARTRLSAATSVTPPGDEGGSEALRVMMVTPRSPLAQGGVERHVLEVSRRLAAAGATVEVLCTDPAARGVETQVLDGVTVVTVRAWPANRDYHFAPRLWTEIGQRRPDLMHVQSYHTLVAPLAMLRALTMRVPFVVTFHGGGHSSDLRNRARALQLRLLRPLLRRAERLVAVARFEVERYGPALGVPAERFALIPNGTEIGPVPEGGEDVNGSTLATIGRLELYKGHHRVLAALPHVIESRPEARLLIVGKGPYEDALRIQAAELGVADRVEITSVPAGDPEGMGRLLGGVSLVVLMSEFETHPLVALEAAAARRRLLVADAGGLAEIAADGFARSVPLDADPETVATAIVETLESPPPTDAPLLTSWDECAASLRDLYQAVALK